MRVRNSPLYCVMDDNSKEPLNNLGKAELKGDIKSGDLLYVKDSFRWGKNSDYAVFLHFFYVIENYVFYNIKPSGGSHCGGNEDVAIATRHRQRISQARFFFEK